jgi:alpha-ketoglutarate-dependent taurine dioxygenase
MVTTHALCSRKVNGAIGSVIENADLTRPLSPGDRAFIGRELYERGVTFIPGQELTAEQMPFAARRSLNPNTP